MALKGKISPTSSIQGKIGPTRSIQAKQMAYTPTQKLSELIDVDTSNRADGSVIIWDDTTQTFKVQGRVENSNILVIGGSF